MSFDELAAVCGLEADAAVEGALGGRVASSGPAVGMAVSAEHGVLLLEAEPCVLRDDVLRQRIRQQTPLVRAVRVALRRQDLAQHQHAVAASNRIRAREHRLQDAV